MHSLVTFIFLYSCESWTLTQQSSKEEYKPWKWSATARYYTSHRKTMLPTRKSVPRSSSWTTKRPPDDHKEMQTAVVWSSFPFIRSGQNHLARHSEMGKKTTEADRGRGGMTTSGNGQAWSLASPSGQWRTGKNGENLLQNHLWSPNDPRG